MTYLHVSPVFFKDTRLPHGPTFWLPTVANNPQKDSRSTAVTVALKLRAYGMGERLAERHWCSEQAGAGPAMSLRLGQALEAGSPGHAADMLVALLASGRDTRLAMLDAEDEEARLKIALDVVNVRRDDHPSSRILSHNTNCPPAGMAVL